MVKQAKRAYLEQIMPRYHKASREERGRILDEYCAVCGYHRKVAIRQLSKQWPIVAAKRPCKKPRYTHPNDQNQLKLKGN